MNRALLVGINEYPDAPLRGCVNDVVDMAKLLVDRFGFARSEIRLVVDARATTQAILARLGWLLTGVRPGDRLLFHYSGHGAQVATRDPQGEVDGLDEVICPVDFDWTDQHLIRDKQFRSMFATVPSGVEFIWVSDSCHSGDLTKDLAASPTGEGSLRIRCMPPPADMEWRLATAKDKAMRPLTLAKAAEVVNAALIAGCASSQTSADASFSGKANGALTYFLLDELKRNASRLLTDLIAAVAKRLAEAHFEQTPQLEGAREIADTPFLGRHDPLRIAS